jgi:hypothetical protein
MAVSPTYWPHAWPSPQPVTLTLFTGPASFLTLPVRPARAEDEMLPPFGSPEHAAPLPHTFQQPARRHRIIQRDLISGQTQLIDHSEDRRLHLTTSNLSFAASNTNTFTIFEEEPLSAQVRCDHQIEIEREAWQIKIETSSTMSADGKYFHVTNVLDVYEGKTRVFTRTWHIAISRDLV